MYEYSVLLFCVLAKVRRLYDIANILTSLEMIEKVHVQEGRGRKPAFRWVGPNPDTSHVDPSKCLEQMFVCRVFAGMIF